MTSDSTGEHPTARSGRGARVRAWLQIIVGVLTITLLTWTVVSNWAAFLAAMQQMNPWFVLAAAVCIFAGLSVNMLSWRGVVRALGVRLGYRDASRVFFVSQLSKYVPGGIWPIVVSAQRGKAVGLPPRISVASMTIALLVGVTVGAVYSTGALFLVPSVRERYWWAPLLLLTCGVIVLAPPVLNRLIAIAFRLLRHEPIPPLRTGPFAWAIVWSTISWGLLGFGLAFLVLAIQDISAFEFLISVASYAIAWVCGFLAIIAPAGAGVREVVLGLTLGTFMPAASVLAVVVVDRIMMTLGDVAVLVYTIGGRPLRRPAPEPGASPVFVTRKYPPSVGGMETLASNTYRALQRADGRTHLIALGKSNLHLVWWFPVASIRLLIRCLHRDEKVILFGDALTWSILGWIPRAFNITAVPMVMGLDVTYTHPLYRMIVHPALRRAPRIIAISAATRAEVLALGIEPERVHIIVLGLTPEDDLPYSRQEARRRIEARYGIEPGDIALLTTGRLVKRKGVRWLVEEVLPVLADRYVYLIGGDGPERTQIEDSIRSSGVADRVRLLGRLSEEQRRELLHGVDLYVQPNIAVDGDVEGFGLVVTESSQAGLLTLAANREGLADAVRDGVTGILVPSGDAAAWVEQIEKCAADPDRLRRASAYQRAAREQYSVEAMASQLLENLRAAADDARSGDRPRQRS